MDILYKKVFNNQFLNRYIYNFVQYKISLYSVDDIQKSYYEIINSYNVVDLEIGTLLKKRQFKLLDSAIDNYFKYVSGNKEDSYKYWYYVINPTKVEIRQLLKWNGLGYNRFKLLFNEFKHIFESASKTLVKSSIIGGNYEIFKFLLVDQGYPLNFKFNHFKSEFEKFNCHGNLEIFKVILENYKGTWDTYIQLETISKISQTVYYSYVYYLRRDTTTNHYPKQTHQETFWITDDPSTTFAYYDIYKYLFKDVLYGGSILNYLHICFRNQDLSLAKATIEIINDNLPLQIGNTHSSTLPINGYTKTGIIFAVVTLNIFNYSKFTFPIQVYNVLEYIFNNHIDVDGGGQTTTTKLNDIIKLVGKSKIEKSCDIYRLNIEKGEKNKVVGTIDFDNLLTGCLEYYYLPNSIQEFDYIVENPKLLKLFEAKTARKTFFKHLATVLCDLDYLKHAFNHYFKDKEQQMIDTNYFIPIIYEMLDSSYEIVQWLFESYINKMKDKSIHVSDNSRLGSDHIFHGSIETLKLVRTKVQVPSGILLDRAVYNNHNQLYMYLLNTMDPPTDSNDSIRHLNHSLFYMIHYNKLDLYKYIYENSPTTILTDQLLKSITADKIEDLPPQFFAYYQSKFIGQDYKLPDGTILSSDTTRDLLLKSIYLNNNYKGLNIIKLNSTKVLDYLISNSSTNCIITNLLTSENWWSTISYLIRFNTKKLIYLIESNVFKISCDNIEFIIKQSILSNNKLFLNYISKSWLVKSNNDNNTELINQYNKHYTFYSNKLLTIKSFRFNFNGL